jgi:hypothetical protein
LLQASQQIITSYPSYAQEIYSILIVNIQKIQKEALSSNNSTALCIIATLYNFIYSTAADIQVESDQPIDSILSTKIEGFGKAEFIKETNKKGCFCTYAHTRKKHENQHWYFCYTCGLVNNKGCCTICAYNCHRDHMVVYSKKSSFYCDCMECLKNCKMLPPEFSVEDDEGSWDYSRKVNIYSGREIKMDSFEKIVLKGKSIVPMPDDDEISDEKNSSSNDSDEARQIEEASHMNFTIDNSVTPYQNEAIEGNASFNIKVSTKASNEIWNKLLLTLLDLLKPVLGKNLCICKPEEPMSRVNDILTSIALKSQIIASNVTPAPALNIDTVKYMKFKSQPLIANLSKETLTNNPIIFSPMSISKSNVIVIAEREKLFLCNIESVLTSFAVPSSFNGYVRISMPISINICKFHPTDPSLLLVAGIKVSYVVMIDPVLKVTNQITLDPALSQFKSDVNIIKVDWVGKSTHIVLCTSLFANIYNISLDAIAPLMQISLLEGTIKDMDVLMFESGQAMLYAAACDKIYVYTFNIHEKQKNNNDIQIFNDVLQLDEASDCKDYTSISAIPELSILALTSKTKGLILITLSEGNIVESINNLRYPEIMEGKATMYSIKLWSISQDKITFVANVSNTVWYSSFISISKEKNEIITLKAKSGPSISPIFCITDNKILIHFNDVFNLSFYKLDSDKPQLKEIDDQKAFLVPLSALPRVVSIPFDDIENMGNLTEKNPKDIVIECISDSSVTNISDKVANSLANNDFLVVEDPTNLRLKISIIPSDQIITGLRIKIDGGSQPGMIKMNLFKRSISFKLNVGIYEILLCEAESLSIANNSLEIAFKSENGNYLTQDNQFIYFVFKYSLKAILTLSLMRRYYLSKI